MSRHARATGDNARRFMRGYGVGLLVGLFVLIPALNLAAGWWI